jgi:hypothetical protein
MTEEDAWVIAELNIELISMEDYLTAYFEGKGFDVSTLVYEKKSNEHERKYYVFRVELKPGYDEKEGRRIYPFVEYRDFENIRKKGSWLDLKLIDFRVEAGLEEGELEVKLYFEKVEMQLGEYQEYLKQLLEKVKQQGGANG